MIFASRSSRAGSTRFLEWRIRLFGVAAILAIFGIGSEQGWMVNLAIGALAVAMLLGMIARPAMRDEGWDEDEDEEAGAAEAAIAGQGMEAGGPTEGEGVAHGLENAGAEAGEGTRSHVARRTMDPPAESR